MGLDKGPNLAKKLSPIRRRILLRVVSFKYSSVYFLFQPRLRRLQSGLRQYLGIGFRRRRRRLGIVLWRFIFLNGIVIVVIGNKNCIGIRRDKKAMKCQKRISVMGIYYLCLSARQYCFSSPSFSLSVPVIM